MGWPLGFEFIMHTYAYKRAVRDVTPSGRLEDQGLFGIQTVLFAVSFLCSLVLFGFIIHRMLIWSSELGKQYGSYWVFAATTMVLGSVGIFTSVRLCFFLSVAFAEQYRNRYRRTNALYSCPFVSILVPCFNEGETIEPALESLLELDYPRYEVLVVNDGSTDDTLAKARTFEGKFGGVTVRVFDKPNGGKWSALNYAFRRSSGELFLCVDADSRLAADSLRRLAAHMKNRNISAVAGQIRVRNRMNILTWLQALEYNMGGGVRVAQGFFGTVLVVPGPEGLYRRCVLEEVFQKHGLSQPNHTPGGVSGPYEGDTFAEDFDLSLTILCLGGTIAYEPLAISYTKAPDRAFALISQRYRWIRGSFQVLRKLFVRVREDPTRARPGLLAWLSLTYLPDFAFAPVLYMLGFGFALSATAIAGPQWLLLGWYLASLLVQMSAGALFLSINRDSFRLLPVCLLLDVYNGLLVSSAWAISVVDELRGGKMRW